MKLIEKLKKIAMNKTFIAWFILVVIGAGIFIYYLNNHKNFTIDNTLPDTLVVDSNYKVKKINPIEFKESFNPHIYGDNVLYEIKDDSLPAKYSFVLYNINSKKTKTTKLKDSYFDVKLSGNYAVLSKLEQPNSDTYFIFLYDIQKDIIIKIGDTRNSPEVLISGNYVYWMGNKQEDILKRYDIRTKETKNYDIPYLWRDAHGSKVVYLESLENKGYLTTGDSNRLVLYDTDTNTTLNLPEDKSMKNYIKLSDDYVVWISDPWGNMKDGVTYSNPKIKYYSIASGIVKDASVSPKASIFDLSIDGNILVYFSNDKTNSGNCLYTYNIIEEKENKILCDKNINGISDSINIDKNVVFDINREDDFKNQLSDVFLLELK